MSEARQRPLVGVSTYRQTTSWWAWERDAALVPGTYLDVLDSAGGQPVLIPPAASCHERDRLGGSTADRSGGLDRLVASLDGLLLIGGGDVDAGRYGQVVDPRNDGASGDRDDLEFALLEAALRADLPVLAVCRGIQVLNVHLGGDLVQQLPDLVGSSAHQPRPGAFGPITVATEPGSTVRHLLGERTEVLCSHHQAIGALGQRSGGDGQKQRRCHRGGRADRAPVRGRRAVASRGDRGPSVVRGSGRCRTRPVGSGRGAGAGRRIMNGELTCPM